MFMSDGAHETAERVTDKNERGSILYASEF